MAVGESWENDKSLVLTLLNGSDWESCEVAGENLQDVFAVHPELFEQPLLLFFVIFAIRES